MNSIFKAPISGIARIMLVLFVVLGVIHLVDFIFNDRDFRNLISVIGFALMSYGIYKNGFGKEAPDPAGRYASIIGVVLVVTAIAMRSMR